MPRFFYPILYCSCTVQNFSHGSGLYTIKALLSGGDTTTLRIHSVGNKDVLTPYLKKKSVHIYIIISIVF